MLKRRFAVLDRDGTIIFERHYLSDPSEVQLLPGSAAGLRSMRELGLGVVVITNQSAIGRGMINKAQLDLIHKRFSELLEQEGVFLDGIYFCPHLPEEGCGCRKPAPALLRSAAQELNFDPSESFVIGDKVCDIELGRRVGATTILVRTGYGEQFEKGEIPQPDFAVNDLKEAAKVMRAIVEKDNRSRQTDSDIKSSYDRVRMHLLESAEIKRKIAEDGLEKIVEGASLIARSLQNGGKLLLCGNGGSAADCQHMAAEFVSLLTKDFSRPGLKAIALTTDTSLLTAYANDFGFEGVFARQVETLGNAGDVLIGISTSGNSGNIIRAVEVAQKLKMPTIVLTGKDGQLGKMGSVAICVPSKSTQHIQESHIAIEHALCDLVECLIFSAEKGAEVRNQ
ncbi:MAG: HAD-IIIA family hydrolase [bacterium]